MGMMPEQGWAKYYPIEEIIRMRAEEDLSMSELLELTPYNFNLFCELILNFPYRFSQPQEFITETFFNPANKFNELWFVAGRKCIAKGTLVFTKDGKVDYIENVGFPTGKKPVYRLKTTRGKEIITSKDHRIKTTKGYKKLKELRDGGYYNKADRVVVCQDYQVFGNKTLNEDKIKILAYLTWDGYWTEKQSIKFCNTNHKLLNEFETSIRKQFDVDVVWYEKADKRAQDLLVTSHSHATGSNPVRNWLNELKFIHGLPELIFELPKKQLALYLNRAFSCCGCVNTRQRVRNHKRVDEYQSEICIAKNDHERIRIIQMLLLKFGIHSWVEKRKNEDCSVLRIADTNSIKNFINQIGLVFGKEEQCSKIIFNEKHLRKRSLEYIKSIEYAGVMETYDQTVEPEGHYIANGIVVHNSAKTDIASAITLFQVYRVLHLPDSPHRFFGIPKGKPLYAVNIGTSRDEALKVAFGTIKGLAENSWYFKRYIKNITKEEIEFVHNIVVHCQSSSSRSVRGFGNIINLYDELAHMQDNSGNLSGDEIYNSNHPNLDPCRPLAISVAISSPGGMNGLFWEHFNTGKPVRVIQKTHEQGQHQWRAVFQYATFEMNPKLRFESDFMQQELKRDPEKFWMERGAQFCRVLEPALPREPIYMCAGGYDYRKGHKNIGECIEDKETIRVVALDPALSGDNYGLAMGHLDKENDKIIIDFLQHWKGLSTPNENYQVEISIVESRMRNLHKRFNVKYFLLDQFQSASTIQRLQREGLPVYKLPPKGIGASKFNQQSAELTIDRIKTLKIQYPYYKTFLNELNFLQRKETSTTVRYEAGIGQSDDLFDSVKRVVWMLEMKGRRRLHVGF